MRKPTEEKALLPSKHIRIQTPYFAVKAQIYFVSLTCCS